MTQNCCSQYTSFDAIHHRSMSRKYFGNIVECFQVGQYLTPGIKTMRVYFTAAAAAMFMMTSAFAQNAATPAANDATMPAVATPESANPNAPVAGSNSFTETQARERLSKAGYADVRASLRT